MGNSEDADEVTLDDVRRATDVQELADEHDMDPDVIDEQLEAKLADRQYQRAQPEGRTYSERFRDGCYAAGRSVFPMNDVPTTATVEHVGVERDNIAIEMKDEDAEQSIRLDSGGKRISRLLNHASVEKPSDLRGMTVPVKPDSGSFDRFDVHVPSSGLQRLFYPWKRLLLRIGAYRETSSRRPDPTRTWILLNGLILAAGTSIAYNVMPTALRTLPFLPLESGGSISFGAALLILGIAPLTLYLCIVFWAVLSKLVKAIR